MHNTHLCITNVHTNGSNTGKWFHKIRVDRFNDIYTQVPSVIGNNPNAIKLIKNISKLIYMEQFKNVIAHNQLTSN